MTFHRMLPEVDSKALMLKGLHIWVIEHKTTWSGTHLEALSLMVNSPSIQRCYECYGKRQ